MLSRNGYGVLIFDPRGTGESEGDPYRWGGERDVKAALAFLRSRADVDPERIGGLGLSLGGELMLQTAGETDALKAVVSEGAGIRSIREQMLKSGAAKWLSAPFWATQTAAIQQRRGQPTPRCRRSRSARREEAPVEIFVLAGCRAADPHDLVPAEARRTLHAPLLQQRVAEAISPSVKAAR
jgi:predicted acyl esterase